MAQICYWNSVQLGLYRTVTTATWGRTAELETCLPAWCLPCCTDSIQMLFREHSLERPQALKCREGNNSKQGCLGAALFLVSTLKGLHWSSLPHKLLQINIIYGKGYKQKANISNAFQCSGEVLWKSDTSWHWPPWWGWSASGYHHFAGQHSRK